jgi:glycosyltransferase involved in cell wall biosynthesis
MVQAGLVSVIMPVHNGGQFVRQAIDSALAQSYPSVEIVVVDDGSTDTTPQVLESFGSRIVHLRQENSGAAIARNTAIRAARGEYLAFLDADDLWEKDKLTTQLAYFQQHADVDLVASGWRVHAAEEASHVLGDSAETTTITEVDPSIRGWIYNELLLLCVLHTTTVVVRRRLVDKIGNFDAQLRRGQDYDYWLRASRVTPIHRLDAKLSIYRLHTSNNTWKPQRVNYGAIVIEKALRAWGRTGPDGRVTPLPLVRRRLADLWATFGYQHVLWGDLGIAAHAAVRSALAWPFMLAPWKLAGACLTAPMRRALKNRQNRKPGLDHAR